MNPTDELNQPTETHETAHLIEALGAVLLFALIGWFVYFSLLREPEDNLSGRDTKITPETKEEVIDQMSAKASTTITVSSSEKQRMIDQMLQPAPSTVKTSDTLQQAVRTPVTPDEKQKMIDAMQQKTP